MPKDTPALYSLMNYADIELGTWYPMGGMFKIIEAFELIAKEQGVTILTNQEVKGFEYRNNEIIATHTNTDTFPTDYVVSGADYHHTDKKLVDAYSNYSEDYWDKRKMAPSSLLFYLGVNKKIENLEHHNLFFDADFDQHAIEIYENPTWPKDPLFYACCPSKTDKSVSPEGHENLFLLVPLAPNLEDTEEMREKYFNLLLDRIEQQTNCSFRENIIYKKSYCLSDFKKDYNAYKGNAYGLANTLLQTAILKPSLKNKKLKNMYYTGQLTVPGPGVPPSIISGEVVAKEVLKAINNI
jgi:phytoene desaturase